MAGGSRLHLLILPFGALGGKLVDATDNRTESFLPADAESTEALLLQEQRFPCGESVTGLIVYRRPGGLTDADRAESRPTPCALRGDPAPGTGRDPLRRDLAARLVSLDGDLAYTIVALPDDNYRLAEWGTDLRGAVHEDAPDGLEVYVTGGLGFNADFEEVFGDLDAKVLLVTVSLVVVLLLLIYRSPGDRADPARRGGVRVHDRARAVYLYAESGATVSDTGGRLGGGGGPTSDGGVRFICLGRAREDSSASSRARETADSDRAGRRARLVSARRGGAR